ncbi:MAG TPA: agmatine deiminase family protein [Bacteroidales bacterium]|nr:agmatine deiminase family protein [Bacteroidales bacterium]
MKNNRTLPLLLLLLISFFNVRSQSIQTPAGFEYNEGVILVWDYHAYRDSIVANIAGAIQDAAKVWIVYYPGPAPADTTQIRTFLLNNGVGFHNVHFVPAYTNTLWVRDFGPIPFYAAASQRLRFYDAGYSQYNRPKDDSLPVQLANYWTIPWSTLPLELEGGNLIFDGFIRGFGSKRIIDQNVPQSPAQIENILNSHFGLQDFVFLDKLLNSGGGIWMHSDMYMKMIDPETILLSELPPTAPDYNILEGIRDQIGVLQSVFGRKYNIFRIPVPPKADGTWATTLNDEMRTYTNSLIINNVVIVPAYNHPLDSVAYQIYQQIMPGYQIVMVDSRRLTPMFGAIHCITREIPPATKLRIRHARITRNQMFNSEIPVSFQAYSTFTPDSVFICFRTHPDSAFQKIYVYQSCGAYLGVIPNLVQTDTVHYYLEAWSQNRSVTYPPVAPDAWFTFWFNQVTDIEERSAMQSLRVYPNPTSGHFRIFHGNQRVQGGIINLFNNSGTSVWTGKVNNFGEVSLPEHLPSGFYVVQYLDRNHTGTTRIIINR